MAGNRELRRKRCRGNARPAPFGITPAIVRGVLELAAAPQRGVVEVPLLPVKLVDQPSGGLKVPPNDNKGARSRRPANDATSKGESFGRLPVEQSGRDRMAERDGVRAIPRPPEAPSPTRTKIDLNKVSSAMERQAATWRAEGQASPEAKAAAPAGKAWCGPCGGYVPANFGDGCISGACPLRGGPHG